nr:alpha/beta hydrolase [Aggregatibacter actinomycetemcomitans]
MAYDGAITENVKGKVNIHPVTYVNNDGIKISANVYTPANFDPNKKYPAITVAHPNGGVKEQVAGLYAQKLAEQISPSRLMRHTKVQAVANHVKPTNRQTVSTMFTQWWTSLKNIKA